MSDDEQKVRNAVIDVICNAMNFPKPASVHIRGRDMGPLGDKIVAAVLPLFAATRSAALERSAVIAEQHSAHSGHCSGCDMALVIAATIRTEKVAES